VEQHALQIMVGSLVALGIVGGTVVQIVKIVFRTDERKAQINNRTALDDEAVKTLRQEIAGLRDTSTQFALSLENSVQRLDERLARVEQRTLKPTPAVSEAEAHQVVGRRE